MASHAFLLLCDMLCFEDWGCKVPPLLWSRLCLVKAIRLMKVRVGLTFIAEAFLLGFVFLFDKTLRIICHNALGWGAVSPCLLRVV